MSDEISQTANWRETAEVGETPERLDLPCTDQREVAHYPLRAIPAPTGWGWCVVDQKDRVIRGGGAVRWAAGMAIGYAERANASKGYE